MDQRIAELPFEFDEEVDEDDEEDYPYIENPKERKQEMRYYVG